MTCTPLRWGPSGYMLSVMGKVIPIKKASGRNVKEAERNTVALKARLSPDVAKWIRDEAERHQCPQSYIIEIAAKLFERAMSGKDTYVSELIEEVDSGDMFTDLYARDE